MTMIRVLLVDDHPVVRSGYRRLLEQTGDVQVTEEADGAAAYASYAARTADVLVTDLTMAPVGGLELLRRVRLRWADARVLIFSMHESDVLVRRSIEAGARGFVTKSSSPDCLVDAVRQVHAGLRYLSPDIAARRDRSHDDDTGRLAALSAREFEIFRLLARGRTAAECARILHLSVKTVANHQTVIKEKLGATTSATLAHMAMRHRIIDGTDD